MNKNVIGWIRLIEEKLKTGKKEKDVYNMSTIEAKE
jgi:hypothetical protein